MNAGKFCCPFSEVILFLYCFILLYMQWHYFVLYTGEFCWLHNDRVLSLYRWISVLTMTWIGVIYDEFEWSYNEVIVFHLQVNFSEPLSMLQRLTEEFEYADCLDRAAACEDSAEQLVHVAAFTISAYSTTINRTTKPFNPLLGETYECDRTDDLGWKSFAEQVCRDWILQPT